MRSSEEHHCTMISPNEDADLDQEGETYLDHAFLMRLLHVRSHYVRSAMVLYQIFSCWVVMLCSCYLVLLIFLVFLPASPLVGIVVIFVGDKLLSMVAKILYKFL